MALFSNTKIVLDIGHSECSIAEYAISGREIILLHSDRMSGMQQYLGNNILVNLSKFASDVTSLIESDGIKSKEIMITGSALNLGYSIENWKFNTNKELLGEFKKKTDALPNKLTTNTSWQQYGQFIDGNDKKMSVGFATAESAFIEALTEAFRNEKFKVVSVIPEAAAIFNLAKLDTDTHERPVRFFIDCGSKIIMYSIKDNRPFRIYDLGLGFDSLISKLAKDMDIKYDLASVLFSTIGTNLNQQAVDLLTRASMTNKGVSVDKYKKIVGDFMSQTYKAIKGKMDDECNANKWNNCNFSLIGGYAAAPGVSAVYRRYFKLNEKKDNGKGIKYTALDYTSVFNEVRGYEHQGKVYRSEDNSSAHPGNIATLGCLLGSQYKQKIELIGASKTVLDIEPVVVYAPILCTIVFAVLLIYTGISWIGLQGDLEDMTAKAGEVPGLTSKQTSLQNNIAALDTGLQVISNATTIAPQLFDFITNYPSSEIRVASVDTMGMLAGGEDSATTTVETDAAEEGEDGEAVNQSELDKFTSTTTTDYILRVYSTSHNAAVTFRNKLNDTGLFDSCDIKGVDMITLDSGEEMFLFEVVVRG